MAGEGGVLVRPVDSRPSHLDPFDARLVGAISYISYFQPLTRFEESVEMMSLRLAEASVVVSRPVAGTVRLGWTKDKYTTLKDYDEAKGYLPIRGELSEASGSGGGMKVFQWWDTTWIKVDGFWVPDTAVACLGDREKPQSRYEMKFAWRSVNRPIPVETFTVRGLGIPDKILIGDARSGTGRAIGLGSVGDVTPDPRLAALDPVLDPPWWRGWRGVAAVVGALAGVVVGALVARLAWSRLRRGRAAS